MVQVLGLARGDVVDLALARQRKKAQGGRGHIAHVDKVSKGGGISKVEHRRIKTRSNSHQLTHQVGSKKTRRLPGSDEVKWAKNGECRSRPAETSNQKLFAGGLKAPVGGFGMKRRSFREGLAPHSFS